MELFALLLMGLVALFNFGAYLFGGFYLVKKTKENGDDTTIWAIVHFAGGLVFGLIPLSIYFFMRSQIGTGLLILFGPFIINIAAFGLFFIALATTA